eukprot:COSAG02_NODE_274_length_26244_cov_36.943507_8_plen_138_part_00
MERLDQGLLAFSTAKKGRFHNYLRQQHPRTEIDSASEIAATGRLSQCRRSPESFTLQHLVLNEDTGSVSSSSLFVLLSFTGKLLTADQVCRMATVLVGCGNGSLTPSFVARSLSREVVISIPAAQPMLYWAEGGFTA